MEPRQVEVAKLRIDQLDRHLFMATEGVSPKNLAKDLAAFARSSLRELINEGAASDRYDRFVNGRLGADEDSVIPPGPIYYRFHWWNEVVEYAMETLQQRSPMRKGRYKNSFAVMADGRYITDIARIPAWAEVTIVNTQPYARKIEVGHMKMSVPHGVVEDSMILIRRRFGNLVQMKKAMIKIPNGYILKGVFTKGVRKASRTKLRRDTQAGAEMTYPAIKMMIRGGDAN